MKSVCLAILSYNGRKHLEFLLPSAIAAAAEYPGVCNVVVIDNRSTHDDVAWTRQAFPGVEVVIAPRNEFLFSYNSFAETRTEEILVLLNNDLILKPGFVAPLVRHFAFDDVFGVTATSRDWDDREFTWGPNQLMHHHGFYWWRLEMKRQEVSHTFFCCGGFMAVDRKKFLAIDGFNPLFHPAYGEDVDLSFRAWRKGWRCLFEPASVALHRESASWSQEPNSVGYRLGLRAQFLFQWSSLPPAVPAWEYAFMVGLTAVRKWTSGEKNWFSIWRETRREWLTKQAEYAWMKTSREERDAISARVKQPVPSSN